MAQFQKYLFKREGWVRQRGRKGGRGNREEEGTGRRGEEFSDCGICVPCSQSQPICRQQVGMKALVLLMT